MSERSIGTTAPNYLAKYRERQNRKADGSPPSPTTAPPLYLRRFRRARRAEVPVETVDGESFTRDYAGVHAREGDRRAAGAQGGRGVRRRDPDHPARHHPGLLHRRGPHADGRLAGPPARALAVEVAQGGPEGPDRLRRHQPGPPDRRADPPRHARRARPVAAQGRGLRARAHPRAAQLRRLDPRRAARRHLRVPPVPGDDGEAGADGGRRPAALARRDRPLLPHPARRGGPDPHVADDPADVLRAARDVRAPVLARVPPADRGEPGPPDRRRHALRPDPRVRHLGARLRPRRAVQHRGGRGEGARAAGGPRWWPTATGSPR